MEAKQFEVEDLVTYNDGFKCEFGKVKSLAGDPDHVFVVYHCDNNWENFRNYTAAKTPVRLLQKGWIK